MERIVKSLAAGTFDNFVSQLECFRRRVDGKLKSLTLVSSSQPKLDLLQRRYKWIASLSNHD